MVGALLGALEVPAVRADLQRADDRVGPACQRQTGEVREQAEQGSLTGQGGGCCRVWKPVQCLAHHTSCGPSSVGSCLVSMARSCGPFSHAYRISIVIEAGTALAAFGR